MPNLLRLQEGTNNLINLDKRKQEDTRWPIDRLMEKIDEYEEILIIAKKKNSDGYTRFSTTMKSTFWWAGCMEAVKRMMLDESLTTDEEGL